jgi:hypothetical protein
MKVALPKGTVAVVNMYGRKLRLKRKVNIGQAPVLFKTAR